MPLLQDILMRKVLRLCPPEFIDPVMAARTAVEMRGAINAMLAWYLANMPHFHPALLDPPSGQFVHDMLHDFAILVVRAGARRHSVTC